MIICNKQGCPYLIGRSCDKQFIVIHESGMCDEWVWRNQMRGPRSHIESGEEPRKSKLKEVLEKDD